MLLTTGFFWKFLNRGGRERTHLVIYSVRGIFQESALKPPYREHPIASRLLRIR